METEDIIGFEILAATGPIHGIGSPPGGDWITVDDLHEAVASYEALKDEIRAPVKLGHNLSQGPLSEFLGGDGAPAAGWLENLRVVGDRLVTDLMAVPKTIARLLKVGAYRGRSVEFYRSYTSQITGKKHGMVMTGLALLGAHLPAVGGLADWAKLYSAAEVRAFLHSEHDAVVLYTPLAPRGFGLISDSYLTLADLDRPWDAAAAATRVQEWAGPTDTEAAASRLRQAYLLREEDAATGAETYRFPIADVVDGELLAIPSAIFAVAEELRSGANLPAEDVDRLRMVVGDYYWRMERTPPWDDVRLADDDWYSSRNTNQEEQTVDLAKLRAMYGLPDDATEEQVEAAAQAALAAQRQVEDQAKKFGLDSADVTAVVEKAKETGLAAGRASVDGDGVRRFTVDEARKLEEDAAAGRAASQRLYETEREGDIRTWLSDGRIQPADVEETRADYDKDPELTRRFMARVKPASEEQRREFGVSDRPEENADEKAANERAYAALTGGGA